MDNPIVANPTARRKGAADEAWRRWLAWASITMVLAVGLGLAALAPVAAPAVAGLAHVGLAHVGLAHVGLAHVGLAHVGLAHVGLAHVGLAHVGLAHVGQAAPIVAHVHPFGSCPGGQVDC